MGAGRGRCHGSLEEWGGGRETERAVPRLWGLGLVVTAEEMSYAPAQSRLSS